MSLSLIPHTPNRDGTTVRQQRGLGHRQAEQRAQRRLFDPEVSRLHRVLRPDVRAQHGALGIRAHQRA